MSNRTSTWRSWIPRWPDAPLALFLSDICALFGTALLVAALRVFFGGELDTGLHVQLSLFLLVAPVFNYAHDLYGHVSLPVPEELRCLAIATSLSYLGIAIYFFLGRVDDLPSRMVYLLAWMCSLFTVPLLRGLTRCVFCKKSWWGVPTVLLGHPAQVAKLAATLRARPKMGFRPTAYGTWDCDPDPDFRDFMGSQSDPVLPDGFPEGLRHLRGTRAVQSYVRRCKRKKRDVCALLTIPLQASMEWRTEHINLTTRSFPMAVLLPEEFAAEGMSFCVRPVEIGHMLGLKVRQNLLDPRRLVLKRFVDFFLCSLMALCLLPVLGFIAVAIRLESKGSPIFRQQRIGQGGRYIYVYKFRTMVENAEEILARCLAEDPSRQEQWDREQKLRDDPRITRVGEILRRTSLDELPQLWNVLRGEMSLVGPRPIVDDEIAKYGDTFSSYMRVRPGITGLWQVSGRSDLPYPERVRLDAWYISNWSTWLDLYILAKTVPVVFEKKGAY